jgi:hypothetical protein
MFRVCYLKKKMGFRMEKKQQHATHNNSNLSFSHCERTKTPKGELGKSRAFRLQTNRRQRAPNTIKSSGKTARERERERERETIPLFIFYTSEKEIYTRN